MRIAVVGAGFAGIAHARVLTELGHEVVVFEKAPDVGGVWSATRRYTGLRTQNNRKSYAFSDMPMPKDYPEWPTGEQVQAYLERYVRSYGLVPVLRLSTEVVHVVPTPDDDGWLITARPLGASLRPPERFDHLVIANGIFSDPVIPHFDGYPDFVRSGGRLAASSQLTDVESVRGKHVVVVGYGKSACDIAAEIGHVAASTTVVARHLLWKMPKRIAGAFNFKYLLLTRMGENLFQYQTQKSGMERFLHGSGSGLRQGVLTRVGSVVSSQLGLKKLGLVPRGEFSDIARSTVSLSTDGFYEQVAAGTIAVHRDTEIDRFVIADGQPMVELSNGESVKADVVVCGTGFNQRVPFLGDVVTKRLLDERGNFQLWKHILPHDVPNLTFAGYNSSFFSPLSAEVGALWVGAHLAGVLDLPPLAERRARVAERLRWMEQRTNGRHARGTNVLPFSLHNIDETLEDLDIDVSPSIRAMQWLLPVNPGAYSGLLAKLKKKIAKAQATAAV
ncbi:flavin-containing monooxygenase [Promicromonospora umidemergens]|uniref:flavin-containing monooxygenase n=1 Tax=Promicromonospora umidemergens TaxID=629679 RepID=UPI0020A2BD8B|nr:NAD(P)/FAD-dependent oxidoreductase [Promicromonospora umidemergens]